MSDDNSVLEGKLDNIIILMTSMNKKLGELLAYIGAKEIVATLKAEDKVEKSSGKNNVIKKVLEPVESLPPDSQGLPEGVIIDLTRVTIMRITNRAVLVSKEGYQKWIPISTLHEKYVSEKHMNQEDQKFDYKLKDWEISEGVFFADKLHLNDNGENWIHTKPWDKLEVRKR